MSQLPITRIVLYKHGVGYFEREGTVEGEATLALTFRQSEVSDVLKSLIILDLDGGHVSSVSYDSTKPLEQLLSEVALTIPDEDGLRGLLAQLKGARVRVRQAGSEPVEGAILGLDATRTQSADGIVEGVALSLLGDGGEIRSFGLADLGTLQVLDDAVRRDLDYYLRTLLSAKKKDTRSFAIFAKGEGRRRLRLAYTVEAPVWKATYRLILGEEGQPPMVQGWAVVDNTQDEDWEDVALSLVAGLPVSFVHDLYTPRYIRRPEVAVRETTGVLPPTVEEGFPAPPVGAALGELAEPADFAPMAASLVASAPRMSRRAVAARAAATTPAQVRERKLGDLFQYEIEHPVTIRRNQAALVPIVLRPFQGRTVLLYSKANRAENPMRCVEFENTTGLTLEGGPVTVLEGGEYVGEAMLDTIKPEELRLVPFAVELAVHVLDNVNGQEEPASRVIVRRGQLELQYGQLRRTTYALHNKSEEERTVYLDHPRQGPDWELAEPAAPFAITESYWRFRFALSPKQVTTFVVGERRLQRRVQALSAADSGQLGLWVDQRYFDEPTEQLIRQIAGLQRQAAEADERIQRLGTERGALHAEQQRIRDNLQSLGDRASEKELRERFIRTLNAQEDRLERIEADLAAQTAQRDRCRVQIDELLGRLEYEAELAPGQRPARKA